MRIFHRFALILSRDKHTRNKQMLWTCWQGTNSSETYLVKLVYVGISTQVNGLAMDWSSGSLYWTDALYNWITVVRANSLYTERIYKHIITTGLLQPHGIAVYPQKGWAWSCSFRRWNLNNNNNNNVLLDAEHKDIPASCSIVRTVD